ncbi:hypothetical protein PE067_01725 [Paracoccus sp. DMF-8]|uniref:hypothetical protein n=1 Tax=Paracoccus sp. DMF-8 TaxID=3019445 RepID=UPI0023E8BD09|nr:hypothetical protein [Paracoccus sp. DMF-8]MDF3604985.1 hypothetical protein [Paracoccus sp. DMF-8]
MLTRIAPIGTYRVFKPVRDLQQRNLARLNVARNYGYVHSAAEALQQARFMTGDIDSIPKKLFPMIATVDADAPRLAARHFRPDVYLVEISSRKAFKDASGWYLQANLLKDKKHDAEVVNITNRPLKDYMKQITDLLGADRVCFVTHINAVGTNGETLPFRSSLIEAVTKIAADLDVPVIDPTELLESHAQRNLLDRDGEDLNHYHADATAIIGDFYLQKLKALGWSKATAA